MSNFTIYRDGNPIELTDTELEAAQKTQNHINIVNIAKEKTLYFKHKISNLQKCPWALDDHYINNEMDDIFEKMANHYEEDVQYRIKHGLTGYGYDIWDELFKIYVGPIISKNMAECIISKHTKIKSDNNIWNRLIYIIDSSTIKNFLTDIKDLNTKFSIKDILEKVYFNDLLDFYIENLK